MDFTLGVLDQSPVPAGTTQRQAIANSIDLARRCEALGYHDYWLAEHHNSEGLAGSAPEIMVGAVAANTRTMRIGAGGVMLSHYSAYKVAEVFRMLAVLYPERVLLGVGRAPGSDRITAAALAKGPGALGPEQYPRQVHELVSYLHDDPDPTSAFAHVRATPRCEEIPTMAMLSSSPGSATIAAQLGLPLIFAHFITTDDGPAIVQAYVDDYQPSHDYPEPVVGVSVAAICASTSEEAELLTSSVRSWRARGLQGPIPTVSADPPEDAASHLHVRNPISVGDPETVHAEISAVADAYGASSVSIVTVVHDHAARVRSYELIADAFGLVGPSEPPPSDQTLA